MKSKLIICTNLDKGNDTGNMLQVKGCKLQVCLLHERAGIKYLDEQDPFSAVQLLVFDAILFLLQEVVSALQEF